MILQSVRTKNFRQLAGENQLSFSSGPRGNVTVILGENGSGKTTLLNAFSWCLYGMADMERPSELLSHRALLDAKEGEVLEVNVEVSFEKQGLRYTFLREQKYLKQDSQPIPTGSEYFTATVRDAGGETKQVNDPVTTIEKLLPRNLSRFFFFRGEDVEALASQGAEKELREGVESFLALEIITRAIRHLKNVEGDLNRSLKEDARGELKALQNQLERVDSEIEDASIREDESRREIRALKQLESEIETRLSKFEVVRPKIEERRDLLGRRSEMKRRREQSERELLKVISVNGFLAFAGPHLDRPEQLAEEAVRTGDLPARIKPQFVDDILDNGLCICGVSINDAMRKNLVEWRAISGLAALEEPIGRMRADIKGLKARREQFMADFRERKIALADVSVALHELDEKISRLNAELDGSDFGQPDIQALQDRRKDIVDKLQHEHQQLGKHEQYLAELNKQKDELIAKRSALETLSEKERILERRIAVVRSVAIAFQGLKHEWSEVIRAYINEDLNQTWAKIAQLERQLEFTSDYTLSMRERSGDRDRWVESAPSSANRRAMALVFISSLIRLAGEIADQETPPGFFEGGAYPLVMDAPFATMDRFFKTQIPRGLSEVVPQIVLISSFDQFDGEVAAELAPRTGKWYVLELHRTDAQGKDLEVSIQGRSVPYVVGEPGAITDWTVIKEVSS